MLILRKEAEKDIKEAYDWYESQREHLGSSFLSEVERTLEMIQEYPELYGPIFKSIRRALCKRFPYAIYFINKSDADIVVVAVLHQRRRPSVWQKRT